MFSLKQRSSMRTWWCTCSSQKRHAWILASVHVLCQVLHLSSVVVELLVNIEYGEQLRDCKLEYYIITKLLGTHWECLQLDHNSEDLTWHMIYLDVVLINSEGSKQGSLFVRQLKRKQACNMMLLPLRQQIIANGKIYWALLAEKLYRTWHHCCWQQPWERRHVKVFLCGKMYGLAQNSEMVSWMRMNIKALWIFLMPRCNTGSSFACGTGGVAETSSSEGILTMTTSGDVSSSPGSPSNPFSCNFENSRNKSCQRAMTKSCLSFSDAKSSGFNLLISFLNMVIENSAYCIIGVLWSREISTISLGQSNL